jgi:phosphoribosylaminoimidazole-succinocarboxamide synthase
MSGRTKLAEGKTKIIWDIGNGEVLVEGKDDITAGDGAKHDLLRSKAVYSTTTTSNCFELLDYHGIPTHFRGRVDERTFRARNVEMIPLELVARRIATGSYLKRRPDVAEGTIFPDVMVEFFEKDDPRHDPLVVIDLVSHRLLRFEASKPLAEGFIGEQPLSQSRFSGLTGTTHFLMLVNITEYVFTTLEKAWAQQGVTLVDLKIECGWDVKTGALLVADVIDNDSWRIWPGGDKARMKDKQVYRNLAGADNPAAKARELGKIKENYAWVAEATAAFATQEQTSG